MEQDNVSNELTAFRVLLINLLASRESEGAARPARDFYADFLSGCGYSIETEEG